MAETKLVGVEEFSAEEQAVIERVTDTIATVVRRALAMYNVPEVTREPLVLEGMMRVLCEHLPAEQRAPAIRDCAARLRDAADHMALLIAKPTGKPS